jgi:hypothetical protein
MYEVFDRILSGDTWHTFHPADDQRFYLALDKIVRNPHFHAQEMGNYFQQKLGIKDRDTHQWGDAIAYYIACADAVRHYLEATGGVRQTPVQI